MERLTKRIDGIAVLESWAIDKDPVSIIQRLCNCLSAYEETGLEPEQVMELKSFAQGGIHKVDDGMYEAWGWFERQEGQRWRD